MFNFALRNLLIFFRQKSAVFFSLLSVFIIIGLYILFLGDIWISNYQNVAGVRQMMDRWIIAGVVAVTPVSTTMGAFSIMVEDIARKNNRDFYASPCRRSSLMGGYILNAFLVGLLMSMAALVLGEIGILINGGPLLSMLSLIKVLGTLLISVLASCSMMFFLISFFSRSSTFSAASSVIGTLIGFVTGIYLPIGSLPETVQWVIKLFPISHSVALMRQIMMEETIAFAFTGAPAEALTEFEETMGVVLRFGTNTITPSVHILVLVGATVAFLAMALFHIAQKK